MWGHVCVIPPLRVSVAAVSNSINVAALSGTFFLEEKDGAGPQGWETLKYFPCIMLRFHYQKVAGVRVGTDSPLDRIAPFWN